MASLLDIAASAETVQVRGRPIAVTGVSASGLAMLMTRFPEFQGIISGEASELSVASLVAMAREPLAALIAAGTGMEGDEAAEKVAMSLGVAEQADLVEAIVRVTLPGGTGPFVERISRLAAALGVSKTADPLKAQATSSPEPSSS